MKIIIYGDNIESQELYKLVNFSLEELGLYDFIGLEKNNNLDLKNKLNISKDYALIVEESNIEFIDLIFEGIIPEKEEIKSMLISIIGGNNNNNCSPDNCGSSCFC